MRDTIGIPCISKQPPNYKKTRYSKKKEIEIEERSSISTEG
jgi:hypothetical protein